MPSVRNLSLALARIHPSSTSTSTSISTSVELVQLNFASSPSRAISTHRAILSARLLRHVSHPITSLTTTTSGTTCAGASSLVSRPYCPFQQTHQRRDLSFLGTLRAVFKQPSPPEPPKKIPKETRVLGRVRVDEYDWMSNKDDPDLRNYVQAENTYAQEYFASEAAAIHLVRREMNQVLRTQKISAPLTTTVRGYEYYTKTSRYGMVYCRRRKLAMAKEEVLLDSAYLPENCHVKKVLLSTAHHIFSFLTLEEGEELGSLHFRDLARSEPYDEVLEGVFNFVWGNDNKTVYYTQSTDVLRPYQVWAHQVGTPQSADILVFQEDDDSIFVDIGSTKDQRFITINGNSLSSSEVRVFDAGYDFTNGTMPHMAVVAPRVEGVEYYVDHHNDHYYILTNDNPKKNFRVMKASQSNPQRESWIELMEAKDGEKIEDVDIFKNFMVIYAKRDALPVISCYHFETGAVHEVPLPEQFCTIGAGVNLEYETDSFQFTLNSPYAHEATYEYDMASRVMTALRVHPIHRLDRSKFTCTRINVPSSDGSDALIPVTLLHLKNLQLNGRNPTLMRAYGAYGVSTEIDFRVEHFPLLERGWIIALAHVRGGSELGTLWYHQGKLLKKRKTFEDFVDVAEHLVQTGYTNPRKLTASGVSAGGLLMGAVCNMRPDLFRAMILNVPFLDPMTTMLNPNIPLTKVEYLEWGNPAESPDMYDYMASYAPYDTIPEYNAETQKQDNLRRKRRQQQQQQQQQLLQQKQEQKQQQQQQRDENAPSPTVSNITPLTPPSPAVSDIAVPLAPPSIPTTTTTTTTSTTGPYPSPPLTSRRPALLISCGERDQRVDSSQSTKFVARLRSRLKPWYGPEGKEACVLMIDEHRGHFGNGTQDDRVKNWAREVVFLLSKAQPMEAPPPSSLPPLTAANSHKHEPSKHGSNTI
ncbi:hypothetical protein EDD11_002799 [Mortierella claussenii]|nr:hypothetical protein EDD11_002799 [Mortierella claussenii]